MKKFLATTALVIASSQALAQEGSDMYFKANVGGVFMDSEIKTDIQHLLASEATFKSHDSYLDKGFIFGGALGYKMMDNLRAELSVDYHPSVKYQYKDDKAKLESNLSADAIVGMVNVYMDLADLDVARIFVGAGVGASYLGYKADSKQTDADGKNTLMEASLESESKTFGLAYALHFGASFEIDEGIDFELAYGYRSLGKGSEKYKYEMKELDSNKGDSNKGEDELNKDKAPSFSAHTVTAGIRFCF